MPGGLLQGPVRDQGAAGWEAGISIEEAKEMLLKLSFGGKGNESMPHFAMQYAEEQRLIRQRDDDRHPEYMKALALSLIPISRFRRMSAC